jgi:hypothetical protein
VRVRAAARGDAEKVSKVFVTSLPGAFATRSAIALRAARYTARRRVFRRSRDRIRAIRPPRYGR